MATAVEYDERRPARRHALLWEPGTATRENAQVTAYMDWLARDRGRHFTYFGELWRWSVVEPPDFWDSLWDYFGIAGERGRSPAVEGGPMPAVQWFRGATVNYARQALRHARQRGGETAVVAYSEAGPESTLTFGQLASAAERTAEGLRGLGVERGDRVAAFLPNTAEALIGLLAAARLGAVWSVCSPRDGPELAIDRFGGLQPKVLIASDSMRYAGAGRDLSAAVDQIRAALPSLAATVQVRSAEGREIPGAVPWPALQADGGPAGPPEELPFEHPLWISYTPDGIPVVHSHGGIILEHLKALSLHHDLGPGDLFAWQADTADMEWYYLVSGLLTGAGVLLYSGSPTYPDALALWSLAEAEQVACLGVDSQYVTECMAAGAAPAPQLSLDRLRGLACGGSLLSPEGCQWIYAHVRPDLQLGLVLPSVELCTMLGGPTPLLPVRAGVVPARYLGARVEAYGVRGAAVRGLPPEGELAITRAMPSMPVELWGDAGGARFQQLYYARHPGAWSQGSGLRILPDGGCIPG